MKPKSLLVVSTLIFTNLCAAVVVSINTSSAIQYYNSDPFFDASVELGTTPYAASAAFDTSTMSLRDIFDDSGPDYTLRNFYFHVDGIFESAFGNYTFGSRVTTLAVQVGHYAWSLPGEYDFSVGVDTFVNPHNPDSSERFWSVTPFTRDGINFKELWDEAPQVYFGGSIRFDAKVLLPDPGVIDEEWLRDELWWAFEAVPTSGGHTMFAGSYSEEGFAFGLVGGYAGPWNGGAFDYHVSEVSVPDSGATLAMLGIGLVGLLSLRRRR